MSHHHNEISGKRLLITTALNLVITVAEVIGGIISNSLALLSDALHNLSDTMAILIAYVANRISRRASTEKKTFGYKRIEILAALLNSMVLIIISIYLFIEAINRFMEPEPIKGQIMFIVATIGLAANLISVLILRRDSRKNLNVKSAYLHLISDTLSSFAVIIGGILIYYFDVFWIDPLVTILISLYILKETWQILKETIEILMQAAPREIELRLIHQEIEKLPEVSNAHHIHIWKLTDNLIHFECHIDLEKDQKVSDTTILCQRIEKLLLEKFNINHVTIQFEYGSRHEKTLIAK